MLESEEVKCEKCLDQFVFSQLSLQLILSLVFTQRWQLPRLHSSRWKLHRMLFRWRPSYL